MHFYQIFIRNAPDLFTWSSSEEIPLGARVQVSFRRRKTLGIIIQKVPKPDFVTQPVLAVITASFLPLLYLDFAQQVSEENFCPLSKVFSLMVPEKFLIETNPVKSFSYTWNKEVVDQQHWSPKNVSQKQIFEIFEQSNWNISDEAFPENASKNSLKTLISKKIIEKNEIDCLRDSPHKFDPTEYKKFEKTLTADQQKAFDSIQNAKKPVVLFGATGSGKTEIYTQISAKILDENPKAQILFLVPEIGLTPQLIQEFTQKFGDTVSTWHSNRTPVQKIKTFAAIQNGSCRILIGTRSAVLLPFPYLQQIILDEEHEWTFKNEFSPRFLTHRLVEYLSQTLGAKLLFGSATPRVESFFRCQKKDWHLVRLKSRVFDTPLPKIQPVDLKNETKKGNFSPFSEILTEEMDREFSQKKRTILFLNRRGFSYSTLCRMCGYVFECPHCDSPMKLHRTTIGSFGRETVIEKLICHICGTIKGVPPKCPECHEANFHSKGWGTQQVESIFPSVFPGKKIARLDADTTVSKFSAEKMFEDFRAGKIDALVGTQMIAKGLDFDDTDLVGILMADTGLSLPDFRAEERVLQLLFQVSGRGGRRKKQGTVVIQTFKPEEPIFKFLSENNYEQFLEEELEKRQKYFFPPFCSLAKITISAFLKQDAFFLGKKTFKNLELKAESFFTEKFQIDFAPAFFPKTHGKYHFNILIRVASRAALLEFLRANVSNISAGKIDIDPSSIL